MADYQSIQMLAFNFESRTFAYRRLAQGLSRSRSAFSSFMREYLERAIRVDQCAQYVDDIGIAANDAKQLCANIRTVFECIRNAGLKLTMCIGYFGVKQVDFLGRTITPEGVAPQAGNFESQRFLIKTDIPQIQKSTPKENRIPKLLPQLHPGTL